MSKTGAIHVLNRSLEPVWSYYDSRPHGSSGVELQEVQEDSDGNIVVVSKVLQCTGRDEGLMYAAKYSPAGDKLCKPVTGSLHPSPTRAWYGFSMNQRKRRSREEQESLVQRWHDSGKNCAEFAAENDIPMSSLYAWKQRRNRERPEAKPKPEFTEIRIKPEGPSAPSHEAEFVFANGITLRLFADLTPERLQSLLQAARAC